jgi:hypothetical protein
VIVSASSNSRPQSTLICHAAGQPQSNRVVLSCSCEAYTVGITPSTRTVAVPLPYRERKSGSALCRHKIFDSIFFFFSFSHSVFTLFVGKHFVAPVTPAPPASSATLFVCLYRLHKSALIHCCCCQYRTQLNNLEQFHYAAIPIFLAITSSILIQKRASIPLALCIEQNGIVRSKEGKNLDSE